MVGGSNPPAGAASHAAIVRRTVFPLNIALRAGRRRADHIRSLAVGRMAWVRVFRLFALLALAIPLVVMIAGATTSSAPERRITALAVGLVADPGSVAVALPAFVASGAFVVAAWALSRADARELMGAPRKVCPRCAEVIPAADQACGYCGHDPSAAVAGQAPVSPPRT